MSWHALENAGYVPEHAPGPVGVFGGMYNASYFQRHLAPRPDVSGRIGELQLMLGNEKDYLTSRVAHKLGLSGPAISVNTACSTSLVAATMAMASLRSRDCDIALAGGVAAWSMRPASLDAPCLEDRAALVTTLRPWFERAGLWSDDLAGARAAC